MAEETKACIRGCRVQTDDAGEVTVPARAVEGGLLCGRCMARLVWALDDAVDVGARVRLAVVPGLGSAEGERVSGSRDPGLPLNVAAMDACDELVATIGEWAGYWARALQIRPPVGLDAVAAGRGIAGVRAGTDPDAVASGLLGWSGWLKVWLVRIAGRYSVVSFFDDVVGVVSRVGRAFPRDEVRVVEQSPRYCPVCGVRGVLVSWPVGSRDPRVACSGCGWAFEAEWKELLDACGIA